MKIDINNWLALVQILICVHFAWSLRKHNKWAKRCQYWRQLCVREQEFIDAAEKRDDYKAAETHKQAFWEYYESFKKELTK